MVAERAHGPVGDLVDDLLYLARHDYRNRAAFGQVAADCAVAVLVARLLPAGIRVGEVRGCLCSIRDCGFSHVEVSGLVMGACRPLLQGLV